MTQREPRFRQLQSQARPTGPGPAIDGRRASRLVTFMVVDLTESSAALERLGEGREGTSQVAYSALLRMPIASHHGRELQRHDDRVLVAFDTPSAATACAVAIMRASERHNHRRSDRLDLRIGIHVGEAAEAVVVSEHGDYTARPVVQAQQLCEAARGGQILASDLVSTLGRSNADLSFERAGLVDLVGTSDPVATFEVRHIGAAAEHPPLPPELVARPKGRCSFVGRGAERESMGAAWSAAASGERRLAFALGEPGIGKSRLAAEVAAEAHADGAIVLSGRSFEESIVPYQPFVEALRQYVVDCDPAELEAQLGAGSAPLVTLVPELASRLPARGSSAGGEGERYQLFDAVAALLSTMSMSAPVLLVLDDLQWADPATLLLLKHIVLDPRPASLLILGLYRDTEVGMSHPVTQLQADIERDFPVDRVTLSGLDDDDVASMLDEMIGWSAPMSVARDLRQNTEGNPFFLQEVIAQLSESGVAADQNRLIRGHLASGELDVPLRVRDFVARRMQRLSPEALEVLGVAAVVGTEFGLDVLTAVLGAESDGLVDHLDEALEARLVIEAPGRSGSYVFSHALYQQVLHGQHGANRRAVLHARVAEAIEVLRPDDPSVLSDLARHYALTSGRYAGKVVHFGTSAGDRALALLAYEDAIEEYTRALEALPQAPAGDGPTEADVLVRLGEAETRAGDAAAAKQAFLAAAERCTDDCGGPVLARAALGYGGTGRFGGVFDPYLVVDETLVGLLDRAIDACPSADEATRARLLGRLAQALYWSRDKERMRALSQEALDIARRIGDLSAIAYALHSRHVALWGPDHVGEVRSAAEEMLRLGKATGDRDIQLKADTWLITDALETDPIESVDDYVAGYARLAEELHRPYLLGYVDSIHATRAHLEGRFDDMARLVGAQLAHGEGPYAVRAQQAYRWQMRLLQLDLGRIDQELLDDLTEVAEQYPGPTTTAMLALAYATLHRRDEGMTKLSALPTEALPTIPRDCMWSATLAMLSRAVIRLGAVTYAGPLYELLAPHGERNCLWGTGLMSFGPISRYLGMLATTLGEPNLALTHLEEARQRCVDLGSPSLVARTKMEMARALQIRRGEGDVAHACSLLEEASRSADEMSMPGLADTTQRMLAELRVDAAEVTA